MNKFIAAIMLVEGQIKVDNMHNVLDIQTTSRYSSSDEDRRITSLERAPMKSEQISSKGETARFTYSASSRSI